MYFRTSSLVTLPPGPLPLEVLAVTYDAMISSGVSGFRNFLFFRYPLLLLYEREFFLSFFREFFFDIETVGHSRRMLYMIGGLITERPFPGGIKIQAPVV